MNEIGPYISNLENAQNSGPKKSPNGQWGLKVLPRKYPKTIL